jgi:hypothetical protein
VPELLLERLGQRAVGRLGLARRLGVVAQ